MRRSAPPPDFRYVGVEPGPPATRARQVPILAGLAAFAAGLIASGRVEVFTVALASIAGICAATIALRMLGPVLSEERLHQARMAIVPWGVRVDSLTAPRVLRWAAVREVQVDYVHDMDYATPSTRWSVVTIRTERETLGGRAPGSVALERLEAHLDRYAEEAARPIALDLDGQAALEELLEPRFERLLAAARRLLHSGEIAERLAICPRSYRDAGLVPSTDTEQALTRVLVGELDSAADPRALALVLAAEIGDKKMLPLILPLTSSPNPMVAAVARGAALLLGGEIKRIGALDELDDFLSEVDLRQIRAWATSTS